MLTGSLFAMGLLAVYKTCHKERKNSLETFLGQRLLGRHNLPLTPASLTCRSAGKIVASSFAPCSSCSVKCFTQLQCFSKDQLSHSRTEFSFSPFGASRPLSMSLKK